VANLRSVSGRSATEVAATLKVDQGLGETFAPPDQSSDGATPSLSADQAWATYASANGSTDTVVPADLSVELGAVSLPSDNLGPQSGWTYQVRNQLAYGYQTAPQWCAPAIASAGSTPTRFRCTRWVFIDANSGRLINMTNEALDPGTPSPAP
jgi:hypothetical protein